MNILRRHFILTTALAASAALTGCDKKSADNAGQPVLRVGFFPNITHAPALVGYHETNTKAAQGWFESRTGAKIEWFPFNAGPSAIEALLTGSIDVTYVGPNPVINGYTRTKGADIRVLSGAARGGAIAGHRRLGPPYALGGRCFAARRGTGIRAVPVRTVAQRRARWRDHQ